MDRARRFSSITALTCTFAVPQMCSQKSRPGTLFTLSPSEIRRSVCRHITAPVVGSGDIHRSYTGVGHPPILTAVKPLQAVAMGLVIVLLGATVSGYDLLADPVGWLLVLVGLATLPVPGPRGAAGPRGAQSGRLRRRLVPRRPGRPQRHRPRARLGRRPAGAGHPGPAHPPALPGRRVRGRPARPYLAADRPHPADPGRPAAARRARRRVRLARHRGRDRRQPRPAAADRPAVPVLRPALGPARPGRLTPPRASAGLSN